MFHEFNHVYDQRRWRTVLGTEFRDEEGVSLLTEFVAYRNTEFVVESEGWKTEAPKHLRPSTIAKAEAGLFDNVTDLWQENQNGP